MKLVMYALFLTTLVHAAADEPCSRIYVFNQLDRPVQVDPFAMLGGQPVTVEPGQTITYAAPQGVTLKSYVTFGSTAVDGKHIFIAPHIENPKLWSSATLKHNDYVTIAKDERGRYRITYAKDAHAWQTFACYINQTTAKHPLLSERLDGAIMKNPFLVIAPDHAIDAESAALMRTMIVSLRLAAIWSQGRLQSKL